VRRSGSHFETFYKKWDLIITPIQVLNTLFVWNIYFIMHIFSEIWENRKWPLFCILEKNSSLLSRHLGHFLFENFFSGGCIVPKILANRKWPQSKIFEILFSLTSRQTKHFLSEDLFPTTHTSQDISKPEVSSILEFWNIFSLISRHLGHFLFEKFFSKPHSFQNIGKPEVAAILDFFIYFFFRTSQFGILFARKLFL